MRVFESELSNSGEPTKPARKADGPKCPACKKATFRYDTKGGKAYFRCGECKSAWWPDRKDDGKLGTKWEAQSA